MQDSLRDYFDLVIETHEGFRTNCPNCGDKEKKLYFNEDKGVGCCFHADCPWGMNRGGVTGSRLLAFFGNTIPSKTTKVVRSFVKTDVTLPKEFRVLKDLEPDLRETLCVYLESRGLTKRTLEQAQVGYCEKGPQSGYIIFPIFENGEVVYWQGRRFKNRPKKFYNPPSSRKSQLVYEIQSQVHPKGIILVESIINALTLDTGKGTNNWKIFALLGKTLSDYQMSKILGYVHYAREIVIALDRDAWREVLGIADRLWGIVPSVRLVQMPEGRDINDVGRERAWELIDNAIPYHREKHLELLHGRVLL